MRPKLLFDVQYRPRRNGISFSSRQGQFVVSGRDALEVMLGLAPYLTGTNTLEEICEQLNPLHLDTAVELIKALHAYGCIVDRTAEQTALSADVQRQFAAQIEFVGQFADAPLRRFERFRSSSVVVAGAGFAARSLIAALARNGLESVFYDKEGVATRTLDPLLVDCRSHNPDFKLQGVDVRDLLERRGVGEKPDVFCYASDTTDLAALTSFFLACRRQEIPFIPSLLAMGKGFVGPLSKTPRQPCWFCLLMRRLERIPAAQSSRLWRAMALDGRFDAVSANPGHAAGIIANLVAFEAFKLLVGHVPTEIENGALIFDLQSLEARKCTVLPHPLCPHCASVTPVADREFLLAATHSKDTPSFPLTHKLRRASVLVDSDIGVIGRFDDERLSQSPIFQAAAVVEEGPASRPVCGYSLHSYGDARLDAMRAVVRHHCVRHPDRRRIWAGSADEARRAGYRAIGPSELSGTLLPRHDPCAEDFSLLCSEWVWALSLQSREVCLVPAAAIYPNSPFNTGFFERTDAGVGVGHCFEEACKDAAWSSAAHEGLKSLALGQLAPVALPLPSLRCESAHLQLVLTICEQLAIPHHVFGAWYRGVSVTIAFSPDIGLDEKSIVVAARDNLSESAAAALTDLVAVSRGGHLSRPLSYYLPGSLGYCLDVVEMERRSRLDSAAEVASPVEMLMANISTCDVQSAAGLTVVKAVML